MNEKFLNNLLKGAIIAAGTGLGMLVSGCFSVKKDDPEADSDELDDFIDAEYEEVKETES